MHKLNSNCYFLLLGLFLFSTATFNFAQERARHAQSQTVVPLIDLRPTITSEEAKAQAAVVRSYLWNLWTSRTKGTFRVRSYSREGDPTNCQYSVEPLTAGAWQVVSRCKGSVCPFLSKAKCRSYLREYVARFDLVQRKEIGLSKPTSVPNIPDDLKLHPQQFILVLRNSVSGATREL
jgi:hypothetical protein